jgi:hypothetical protein
MNNQARIGGGKFDTSMSKKNEKSSAFEHKH